jgi:hypothetical protein
VGRSAPEIDLIGNSPLSLLQTPLEIDTDHLFSILLHLSAAQVDNGKRIGQVSQVRLQFSLDPSFFS